MKEQIKQLRVEIDGLHQLCNELKPVIIYGVGVVPSRHFGNHTTEIGYTQKQGNSKEIEKAAEKLIFAKAWLGKVLGELREETPYKNDGNRKTKEDIEPTADTCNPPKVGCSFEIDWSGRTHIEKVDWLREELKRILNIDLLCICNDILNIKPKFPDSDLNHSENRTDLFIQNVYNYISEARFWLGFELQRLRDEYTTTGLQS